MPRVVDNLNACEWHDYVSLSAESTSLGIKLPGIGLTIDRKGFSGIGRQVSLLEDHTSEFGKPVNVFTKARKKRGKLAVVIARISIITQRFE